MKLLVLYDGHSAHIGTVREYLASFRRHSRHDVYYAVATHNAPCAFPLDCFDAVLIHYSVRLCYSWHLSPQYAARLSEYQGLKMLTIQDEYDWTETARQWMERLGIGVVFTCVPDAYIDNVYPKARFPQVEFINVLTGYVPADYEASGHQTPCRPFHERKNFLGYRGRSLPFYYGDLCREKTTIAQRMREHCLEQQLPCDIEWDDQHRIYGPDWHTFIQDCRAVLGTESGSNVFDDDGRIREQVKAFLEKHPDTGYDEVHARFVKPHEGAVAVMNQVSPRVFEAVFLKTAMVLLEGGYSGVVQPWIHYIPLKKDFSNADEVLGVLADEPFLRRMVERAYADVIGSGRYTYRQFVAQIDGIMERRIRAPGGTRPFAVQVVGGSAEGDILALAGEILSPETMVTSCPLSMAEREQLVKPTAVVSARSFLRRGFYWLQRRFRSS